MDAKIEVTDSARRLTPVPWDGLSEWIEKRRKEIMNQFHVVPGDNLHLLWTVDLVLDHTFTKKDFLPEEEKTDG